MQTELNHTVKSLFGKESLDDMSRDDLLMLTTKYPYASILHFLYTRKLQSSHDLRYPASVAKTALYFSNPHWLHHQLRAKTSVEALAEMEMAFEKSATAREGNEGTAFVHLDEWNEVNVHRPVNKEEPEPLYDTNEEVAEEIIESTSLGDNPTVDFSTQPEEQNALNNFMAEQMETVPDEKAPEFILESQLEPLTEKIELPEPIIDFPPDIEESGTISQELHPALETEDEISIPEIIEEQPSTLSAAPIITPIHPDPEPVSEMVEIPLEPLYAVDYFASQGIRLREEDQQDQLGKKLKSFTEWLKSMKKVHPEKSKGQMDEKTEAAIKSEAELSNDKADVLTETMAEVFIKQGLTQKAIDVYEKLSLLDPLKSATFAAKISELKAQ